MVAHTVTFFHSVEMYGRQQWPTLLTKLVTLKFLRGGGNKRNFATSFDAE